MGYAVVTGLDMQRGIIKVARLESCFTIFGLPSGTSASNGEVG